MVFGELPKRDMAETDVPVLIEVIDTLSAREAKVIKMHYGLSEYREHTLKEVGEEFNITVKRIRQIKDKALRKLKGDHRAARIKPLFYSYSEWQAEIARFDERFAALETEYDELNRQNCRLKSMCTCGAVENDNPNLLAGGIRLDDEIEVLKLSARAYNSLSRGRIPGSLTPYLPVVTVRDLIERYRDGDVAKFHNLGKTTFREIEDKLASLGVPLNT